MATAPGVFEALTVLAGLPLSKKTQQGFTLVPQYLQLRNLHGQFVQNMFFSIQILS